MITTVYCSENGKYQVKSLPQAAILAMADIYKTPRFSNECTTQLQRDAVKNNADYYTIN